MIHENLPPDDLPKWDDFQSAYSYISEITLLFEKRWYSEYPLLIEQLLEVTPSELKEELFERLLEIEISLCWKNKIPCPQENYLERFPQYQKIISKTYEQFFQQIHIVNQNRIGRTVGKGNYTLKRILGEGGMGVVYEAECHPFKRSVAIKYSYFIKKQPSQNPSLPDQEKSSQLQKLLKLFEQEIKLHGKLKNGSIFALAYDCGVDDNFPYLVLEYIEGENLAKYVRQRQKDKIPLSFEEAAQIILQAARGLKEIHSLNILHRDIKPENFIRTKEGKIRILDLGLAQFLPQSHTPNSDKEGSSVSADGKNSKTIYFQHPYHCWGTPAYMPPEVFRDPQEISFQSDLFSLGGTFFYLLSGERPTSWKREISLEDYFAQKKISIPKKGLAILAKLLDENPGNRYSSAEALHRELDNLLEKPRRRQWWLRRILIGGVLLLTLGYQHYYLSTRPIQPLQKAEEAYCEKDFELALSFLKNVSPSTVPQEKKEAFYLLRGDLYQKLAMDQEHLRQALKDYRQVLLHHPRHTSCLQRCAQTCLALQEYRQARTYVRRAAQLEPDNFQFFLLDARIGIEWSQLEVLPEKERELLQKEAADLLEDVLQALPESAEALFWRAKLYFLKKDYDFALGDLRQLLQHTPKAYNARKLRTEIRLEYIHIPWDDPAFIQRQYEDLIFDYQFLLKYFPNLPAMERADHASHLAYCYWKSQESLTCIAACEELLQQIPDLPAAKIYRGMARFQHLLETEKKDSHAILLQEWEKVEQDLQSLLQNNQLSMLPVEAKAECYAVLGITLLYLKKFSFSVDALTKAIEQNSEKAAYTFGDETWNLYDLRRQAHRALNQFDKTREDAQKSFEIMSQSQVYHSNFSIE